MDGLALLLFGLGLAGLALVSAFISAVETAIFSIPPSRLEALKTKRSGFAETLGRWLENPRRLLSAVLLADAFANVPLMVGCVVLLETQQWLQGSLIGPALVIFGLIVFACDLVPKMFALGAPQTVAILGVPLVRVFLPLLDPVARILERGSERITDAVLPATFRVQRHLSEEELETLVELSAETGALHETESEMISEIIKLGDKTAKDCMTPRVDMFALPDDLTNEEALRELRKRRYRRVPVYGETPDDLEGVLDVAAFLRDPEAHYTERLDLPSFVPETMKAITLLKNFLTHAQGLAIVVDEHGGVEGVVTLADLVEEIISDAVPQKDAKLYLEVIGEGRLLANGNARLEDISEELGVSFEDPGVDTIGGLIFNQLGHLPKAGQRLQVGPLDVLVRRVSRKRVEEVQVTVSTNEEVAE
jgi:putative hemolysin